MVIFDFHVRNFSLNARAYAGARDLWECDFITLDTAFQACVEIKPAKLDAFVKNPHAALRRATVNKAERRSSGFAHLACELSKPFENRFFTRSSFFIKGKIAP